MEKIEVLIASPVRQKPNILGEFLKGLINLETEGLEVDFAFVDDNTQQQSKDILRSFYVKNSIKTIIETNSNDNYVCDENTHRWNNELILKVAGLKNKLLNLAKVKGFDYIFLVDSDLVLHPKTLVHLVQLKKDIISEVFWTMWVNGAPEMPQVWVCDQYDFMENSTNEKIPIEQQIPKINEFFEMLKKPGIYKVGGLGACTLISRKALIEGVSFEMINNLSLTGEDRHFCVRAAVLGFELFADTYYPPFHIYRESDLERL